MMSFIRWYADNSELTGIWEAAIPDILLFGGVIADEDGRSRLCSTAQNIKALYAQDVDFPLKRDFRNLEYFYDSLRLTCRLLSCDFPSCQTLSPED
jgi:hypothetical protein